MNIIRSLWNTHKVNWSHFLWMGSIILVLGSIIIATGNTVVFVVLMACIEVLQFDNHVNALYQKEGRNHPIRTSPLHFLPLIATVGAVLSWAIIVALTLTGEIQSIGSSIGGFALFLGGQMNASRFIHRIQHENIFDYKRQDEAAFFECLGATATLVAWSVGVHILIG